MKHVSTWWLGLEFAVEWALQQYDALKSYILFLEESQIWFQHLKHLFQEPGNNATFYSFQQIFTAKTPFIHLLMDKMESFYSNVLSKFFNFQ